jgi:hypothetical protein
LISTIFFVRRQPVMQRKRVAFVLEDDARTSLGDGGKLPLHGGIEGGQPRRFRRGAGSRAQLGAVTADRRQLQGGEDEIELAHRSAAHESDAAIGPLPKSRQRVAQFVRNENLARRGSKVENRSVDVEQKGELLEIGRERRNGV